MADTGTARRIPPCPECGGDQIEEAVMSAGRRYAVLVANWKKMFGMRITDALAVVCIQCGYTRFYAKEPEKLRGKR